MNKQELLESGFTEFSYPNIGNKLTYDLGRDRFISIGSISTPNEMMYIGEREGNEVTNLVVLKNYDFDGYTSIEDIKTLINLLKWK